MLGLKKKEQKAEQSIRIMRIARQEWTTGDMSTSAAFVKSPTFAKMHAFCDEQLLAKILYDGASEDYRKGFIEALNLMSSFNKEPEVLRDSLEQTSLQLVEE